MRGLPASGHISLDQVHEVAKRMQGDFLGTLIACGASGVVLGFWYVHSTSMRDVQQSLMELWEQSMRQHGKVRGLPAHATDTRLGVSLPSTTCPSQLMIAGLHICTCQPQKCHVEGQQWFTRLLLLCLLQDILLVTVDNPRNTASPGAHGVRLLSCMQSSALQQQQQQQQGRQAAAASSRGHHVVGSSLLLLLACLSNSGRGASSATAAVPIGWHQQHRPVGQPAPKGKGLGGLCPRARALGARQRQDVCAVHTGCRCQSANSQ
jgi:hypothetical protein